MSVATRRAERREVLIELAINDIVDYGIEGCSFRTLAKRAGTTTAPFTYAFGSRARMLDAVAEYTWQQLDEPKIPLVDGSPLATIKAKARRWTPIDEEIMHLVYVYIDLAFHAVHNEELAETMKRIDRIGEANWRKLIVQAQAAGEIDSTIDADVLISQIWALCDGFAVARMSYPDMHTSDSIERSWSSAFDRLVMPAA